MTLRDWLWVLVRGGGLTLAVFAILAIPEAFAAGWTLRGMPSATPAGDDPFEGVLTSLRQANTGQLARAGARLILLGSLSWYMLFQGQALINLMHRAPQRDTPTPDPRTSNPD